MCHFAQSNILHRISLKHRCRQRMRALRHSHTKMKRYFLFWVKMRIALDLEFNQKCHFFPRIIRASAMAEKSFNGRNSYRASSFRPTIGVTFCCSCRAALLRRSSAPNTFWAAEYSCRRFYRSSHHGLSIGVVRMLWLPYG